MSKINARIKTHISKNTNVTRLHWRGLSFHTIICNELNKNELQNQKQLSKSYLAMVSGDIYKTKTTDIVDKHCNA